MNNGTNHAVDYLRQRKSDAEVAERVAHTVDPENEKLYRGYRMGLADALTGHMTITAPALTSHRAERSTETQKAYWSEIRGIMEKQNVTLKKARTIYRKSK